METSNVQPMIEPDAEQMRRHVAHLFEGWLDGCHEGRIELAWTDGCDGRDGRLRHAALFGTDELDQLVARAVAEIESPGRTSTSARRCARPARRRWGDARTKTYSRSPPSTSTWTMTSRPPLRRGCPPTAVVVTGRHPHVRAQMLWRLTAPERDALICPKNQVSDHNKE
jgi:hypothetical protein